MSASNRAHVLLRNSSSRASQWMRWATSQRLPLAVSVLRERRRSALSEARARGFGSISCVRAPRSSSSRGERSVGLANEAVASEASDSEVSETSSSISQGDASSQSSFASSEGTTSTKDPWRPEFGFAFE